MDKKNFQLNSGNGKLAVRGDIYHTEELNQPILIICHGFKAYREWGFFPYIAEQFALSNMIVINIDFSQNGIVDPIKGIFDDNIFRTITVTQEIADLNNVIDSIPKLLKEQSIVGWNGDIYLMGHSLGGAVSVIVASERNDIKKIVTWASIGDIDRNTDRQKAEWREKGVIEFENRITGQTLHLDVEYLEDKLRNKVKYSLEICASKLSIPMLIIHGDKDFTVRTGEADILHNAAINSEIKIISKANHTFNCRHPFTGTNEILDEAILSTNQFLSK